MVLSRRHIESYLWDDEILTELCVQRGHADRAEALLAEKAAAITRSRARGNPPDDVKSAVGELFNVVRTCLGLAGMGNDASSFARNTLAPLIKPGMRTYAELESDIFAFHGRMTRQEC